MKDPYNLKYAIPKNVEQAIRVITKYYEALGDNPPEVLVTLSRLDVFVGKSKNGASWKIAQTGFHKPLIDVSEDGTYSKRIEELSYDLMVRSSHLPDKGNLKPARDGYQKRMEAAHIDSEKID